MGPTPPLLLKSSMVSSSPGRAEKLPTPGLARLLRGKGGSRSRGRGSLSRSSFLFSSGSRSRSISRPAVPLDAGDEGEPSSPKVTCIGQVRIRKKPKSKAIQRNRNVPENEKQGEREMLCCSIKTNLFRRSSAAAGCRSIWRRCSVRFRFDGKSGYLRGNERIEPAEAEAEADPLPLKDLSERDRGIFFNKSSERKDDADAECDESEIKVFAPPKNALVLMRCRSAPHNRSSALATRFFPISVAGEGEGGGKWENKEPESNGSESDDGRVEEEEGDTRGPSSQPLFLKRCKSEPETKAVRLSAPVAQKSVEWCRRSAEAPSQVFCEES